MTPILPQSKELKFSDIRLIENWRSRLPEIVRCIESNPNLESVNIDEYPDDDDFYGGIITTCLREAVVRNPNVQTLRFGWVGVIPLHMVTGFRRMKNLLKLEFDSTEMFESETFVMAQMLLASANLQELVLDTGIGNAAAIAMTHSFYFPHKLVRMKLKNCYMTEAGLMALGRSLEYYSSLVTLEVIERDPFGVDPCECSVTVARVFAHSLPRNTSIHKLHFEFDLICPLAAKYLFEGLAENTTIKDVYIGSFELGRQGSLAAAHLISHNNTLECLCLTGMYSDMSVLGIENESCCYEGGIDIVPICQALASNQSLKSLVLNDWVMRTNGMEDDFSPPLLAKNTTLANLDIRSIHIPAGGIAPVCQILVQSMAALTNLFLVACKITDVEITDSVCNVLRQCPSIKSVALCTNRFGDVGAVSLATVLRDNTTLSTVNLKFNHRVRQQGTRALLDAVRDQTLPALESVFMPSELTSPQTAELEFYMQRNKWPMPLLREKKCLPLNLWPRILERTDKYSSMGLDLLYFVMKEKSEELSRNVGCNSIRTNYRKRKALQQSISISTFEQWKPVNVYINNK